MNAKILAIEDTADMAVLIKGTLKNRYDLTICKDGHEALEVIDKESFDIILLDLMLPDISGFELASILKEHPNTEKAYIIVISAKDDIPSKITAYGLGAINYIEKPFDPRLLRAVIKSLIALKNNIKEAFIELGDINIDLTTQTVTVSEEMIKLTSSEYKILCYMLQRENQICSREKLLNVIDPGKLDTTDRLIDSHISSLRKKLNSSILQIKSSYGEGYLIQITKCE